MHYVYLTNNEVTDQAQVNPFTIFSPSYAEQFIEAPDEVTFGWSLINGVWNPPPPLPPPTPEDIQQQNKITATQLLSATDWTSIADVADPLKSNPYLVNQNEFVAWRSKVREVAVNPPTTVVTFPTQPTEQWATS